MELMQRIAPCAGRATVRRASLDAWVNDNGNYTDTTPRCPAPAVAVALPGQSLPHVTENMWPYRHSLNSISLNSRKLAVVHSWHVPCLTCSHDYDHLTANMIPRPHDDIAIANPRQRL